MTEIDEIKNAALEAFPSDYYGYNDGTITGCDNHYKERKIFEKTALYLKEEFKKPFYGVELKNHGIIAYFRKKIHAEEYLEGLLKNISKNNVDLKYLLKGVHYNIIELRFED